MILCPPMKKIIIKHKIFLPRMNKINLTLSPLSPWGPCAPLGPSTVYIKSKRHYLRKIIKPVTFMFFKVFSYTFTKERAKQVGVCYRVIEKRKKNQSREWGRQINTWKKGHCREIQVSKDDMKWTGKSDFKVEQSV